MKCQARLQHLQTLGTPAKDEVISWNRKRLDRLLVDHLLHSGYYTAAETLTSESNITVIFTAGVQIYIQYDMCTRLHMDVLVQDVLSKCRAGMYVLFMLACRN